MSVLDPEALGASPLADLHAIAAELGIDGFRRLRKAALIDAIVARQGGAEAPGDAEAPETEGADDGAATPEPRRPRRRGRTRASAEEPAAGTAGEAGGRAGEAGGRAAADRAEPAAATVAESIEGTVELLSNGSGFVRVSPPEPSDDDVYISAAQVRRCELVSGDVVSGPVRSPRRSERYPSLIRVETINGAPADEVAAGTRFDDLPVAYPSERLALPADDDTLRVISEHAPIGKGSRVTIAGPARSGKTEALRHIGAALAAQEGLELRLVLVGVRPEEVSEWRAGSWEPVAALSFAASVDAQTQALEGAIEQAKRVAARGGDAVVLIDTLDGVHLSAARRALAAARNIVDGGSLTVVATAQRALGGETTVIELDGTLASQGRYPAIDPAQTGTLRRELLG